MTTYMISKDTNPLIKSVLIRRVIFHYLASKKAGSTHPDLDGLSAITWALLRKIEFEASEEELEAFESYAQCFANSTSEAARADHAVFINWIHQIRTCKTATHECEIIPPPCHWKDEDAAMGCFILLRWVSENSTKWLEVGDERQATLRTVRIFSLIAIGQLCNLNFHPYMNMEIIETVQLYAFGAFVVAQQNSDKAEAHDAIRALIWLNQLWFKLRNNMSPQLTTDRTYSTTIQITDKDTNGSVSVQI